MIDTLTRKQTWNITPELIEGVVTAIRDRFLPEMIVLFGSAVRGGLGPGSDLDLLVVMQSDLPALQRATAIRLMLRPSPCPMDILVFTPDEVKRWNGAVGHIITEAFATGRIVYERKAA